MSEKNYTEEDLMLAWKTLEQKKFKEETDKQNIMEAIKLNSKSTISLLKKGLRQKLYWSIGITFALVVFMIFQRDNIEMIKLIGIAVGAYVIGSVAMYISYRMIKEDATADLLNAMKTNERQIKNVLRVEMIWGMIAFIPSIIIGMLISQVQNGFTIAESFSNPSFLKSMLIGVTILVPFMYWLTNKMNDMAYGKNLRQLKENIIKMETLA